MQFKNMNELVEYLGTLEERIKTLEVENVNLRAIQPIPQSNIQPKNEVDGNTIVRVVSRYIPKTDLFSTGFLKRAFAVWGHFFVANLIIGTIGGAIYFCIVMVGVASFLQGQ